MARAFIFGIAAAAILFPALASAQSRSLNNEAVCSNPGYGMDPRCVGETNPGAWNDSPFAIEQRGIVAVPQQPRRR